MEQIKKILLPLIPVLAILFAWQLVSYFSLSPAWLTPSPIETAKAFWSLIINGVIFKITIISIINLVPAFIAGVTMAIFFGVLIGLFKTAQRIFMPTLSGLYAIPSIAWLPFIILIFGFTRQSIWVVIFISCFLRMIYNVINGVRRVNPNWILIGKNFGLGWVMIIIKIILPGSFPSILTGMRLSFNSSLRSLIAAEMLVTTFGGLGRFIWLSQWSFSFDKMFAGIIIIALLGITAEILIFRNLEKRTSVLWGLEHE